MKVNLNTWQRVMLLQAVGTTEGNAMLVYKAGLAIRSLEFTDDEKKQVNMRADEGTGRIMWDSAGEMWDVDIPDSAMDCVKSAFNQYRWPAAAYREVEAMASQLGIKLDV